MEMEEMKKRLAEILPEGSKLSDEVLEQIAGGLKGELAEKELKSRLAALGLGNFNMAGARMLFDAKPQGGGLKRK